MPFIQTKNAKIYYEELGNPSDPMIILIMGLATQLIAWPESMRYQLRDAGFRVVCFDNRDCGLSSKFGNAKPNILHQIIAYRLRLPIKAPYSLSDMADDTAELISQLGADSAHVIGASMGGMIGQILAAKYPDKVASLTTIMSSSGHRKVPMPKRQVIQRFIRRANLTSREDYINFSVETIQMIQSPAYPTHEDEIKAYIEAAYHRCHYPLGYIRQLSAILASGDRTELLRTIKCPTLVIHGKDDPLSPVYGGVHTALQIPGAKLELIDGMGHNFPTVLLPKLTSLILTHIEHAKGKCGKSNQEHPTLLSQVPNH